MNLGKNIYNLRKKKGITQEELAEKINVTRQTISNWELGETSPNPEQLKLLSKSLGVSIDNLVGNETIVNDNQEQKTQELINKYKVVLIIDIICSIVWGISVLIAIMEKNKVTAVIYFCLSLIWMFIAIIWYLTKIKNK